LAEDSTGDGLLTIATGDASAAASLLARARGFESAELAIDGARDAALLVLLEGRASAAVSVDFLDGTGGGRDASAARFGALGEDGPLGDGAMDGAKSQVAVLLDTKRWAGGTAVLGGTDELTGLDAGAASTRLVALGPAAPFADGTIDRAALVDAGNPLVGGAAGTATVDGLESDAAEAGAVAATTALGAAGVRAPGSVLAGSPARGSDAFAFVVEARADVALELVDLEDLTASVLSADATLGLALRELAPGRHAAVDGARAHAAPFGGGAMRALFATIARADVDAAGASLTAATTGENLVATLAGSVRTPGVHNAIDRAGTAFADCSHTEGATATATVGSLGNDFAEHVLDASAAGASAGRVGGPLGQKAVDRAVGGIAAATFAEVGACNAVVLVLAEHDTSAAAE